MKKQFILPRNKTKPVYTPAAGRVQRVCFFVSRPVPVETRHAASLRFHGLQFVEMCRQAPDTGKKMLRALTGVPAGTQYKEERTKINHILHLTAHILYLTAQNSGFS